MTPPFLIHALSRSRTAWLSEFLTYGPWRCGHEIAMHMRSLQDVRDFFAMPYVGTAETAAAQGYWLARHYAPGLREVVIRRPIEEVVQSFMALDLGPGYEYDEAALRKRMAYGDRMLDKIADRPGVMQIDYRDLETEEGCADIFEHCLQAPFDRAHWLKWKNVNVQVDMRRFIRYYHAHEPAIVEFKRICKAELRQLARAGALKGVD